MVLISRYERRYHAVSTSHSSGNYNIIKIAITDGHSDHVTIFCRVMLNLFHELFMNYSSVSLMRLGCSYTWRSSQMLKECVSAMFWRIFVRFCLSCVIAVPVFYIEIIILELKKKMMGSIIRKKIFF